MKSVAEKYKDFWNNQMYEYCYIAVDIHGTIFKPTFEKTEIFQWYPLAKACLKELTKNPKVKLILWSGCYEDKFNDYIKKFEEEGIKFDYINENPECINSSYACFDKKFYFDIGIDDRFGFESNNDWVELYSIIIAMK